MLSRNTNDDHSIKGMGTQGVDAKNGPSPSRPSHSRVPLHLDAASGVDIREHAQSPLYVFSFLRVIRNMFAFPLLRIVKSMR